MPVKFHYSDLKKRSHPIAVKVYTNQAASCPSVIQKYQVNAGFELSYSYLLHNVLNLFHIHKCNHYSEEYWNIKSVILKHNAVK